MRRRIRVGRPAGADILAAGLLALGLFATVPAAWAAPVTASDPKGDTVVDTVEDPIEAPRGDIVATAAEVRPDGIALSVKVAQPADPMTDPNWASFDSVVTWTLEVSGDGKRDYEVEYLIDEDTKGLSAALDGFGVGRRPADGCDPPASYSPDAGYTVVVDPKCIATPASFSYKVEVSYNTDASKDSADVSVDLSPDEGWAGPVEVPGGVPGGTPVAPRQAAPNTPSAATPRNTSPSASPTVPGPGPGPATAAPSRPTALVKPGAVAGAPRPAAQAPGGVPVNPTSAPPDTALARTGGRAVQLAGFAVGIALIGFGLTFATRRPAHALR